MIKLNKKITTMIYTDVLKGYFKIKFTNNEIIMIPNYTNKGEWIYNGNNWVWHNKYTGQKW